MNSVRKEKTVALRGGFLLFRGQGLDAAGADFHLHTRDRLRLKIDQAADLGSDIGVGTGIADGRTALARLTAAGHIIRGENLTCEDFNTGPTD